MLSYDQTMKEFIDNLASILIAQDAKSVEAVAEWMGETPTGEDDAIYQAAWGVVERKFRQDCGLGAK